MDSVEKTEDARSTESRVKSLIGFLITTCFSRLNDANPRKMESYREKVKEMLNKEEKQNEGEKEKYNYLRSIVDSFFDYIGNEQVVKKIQSGKLKKRELEEEFLEDVINIPKRKYDMRDLYNPELISSYNGDKSLKKIRSVLRKNGTKNIYIDEEGRQVILTDVGTIEYEEWGGMRADLSMYLLQKERPNGNFTNDIVCTNVIIQNMEDPGYRNAVLKELFSDKNIQRANANSYIGQICRRKKANNRDLPKTEYQTSSGYTYRIDENYVLEYDATELTAVIETVRQYQRDDKRREIIDQHDIKSGQVDSKRGHGEVNDYDEHDGR